MATIPTHEELEHLAKRLDVAPEFAVNKLDGLEGAWVDGNLRVYIAGARAGWEKCASLVRAPSGDVVAVPREEWDELVAALPLEDMSDREMMSWCRDLNIYDPTPQEQMIAKHIWSCAQDWTKRKFSKLRALRSGEAGKDAIYCGEHTAAEIPAILAAHPGYTLPSSHDF